MYCDFIRFIWYIHSDLSIPANLIAQQKRSITNKIIDLEIKNHYFLSPWIYLYLESLNDEEDRGIQFGECVSTFCGVLLEQIKSKTSPLVFAQILGFWIGFQNPKFGRCVAKRKKGSLAVRL